jgi:hypothetical protein
MLSRLARTIRKSFLWLFAATLICNGVYGQNKISEVKLTVHVTESTLAELLDVISQKSGIAFSYNPKKISSGEKVTYHADDKSLGVILNDLSERFSFNYELIENQIILKPEKKPEKNILKTSTFSGTIKDTGTGEALIGCTVLINLLGAGTVTNAFGFFSLTVPKGKYAVTYSFIGYQTTTDTVDLHTSVQRNLSMAEQPPQLDEIVISSSNSPQDVVNEIHTGKINIRPAMVQDRPSFFGEMDVIKSLESVPGIKLHSDGSTFYYVRGGNRDENLILIDDAPIYNPSHILGIFSTIIPDVVNDITVYKGDMPASYGGRLSSVLDVRTKKGNDQKFETWGNVGPISSKLGIEGPIKKNASSFLLSSRISRLRWLMQLSDRNIERFNFYDVTGKLNVSLNRKNKLLFSFYTGADNFAGKDNGISWANNATTLRWNHVFNDKLFLNTTAAASSYDYFLYTNVTNKTGWQSHIANFNIKTDFSYFIRPDNEVTFGAGLTGYGFNPGNLLLKNTTAPVFLTLSVKNSAEFVVYGNHEVKLNERWGINYGLRLSSWTNSGDAFEFIFDKDRNPIDTLYFEKGVNYKHYNNREPRLTLSYQLHDHASVKTSFSRNVQNVHLISNSISPFTSMEVWLPSSINIKPQIAKQATLGYYGNSNALGIAITAEAFYKKLLNQIDYNAHAPTLLNPLLERELRFGTGTSYGIELLAKKDEGRVRGWAGYTYARAKRNFTEINNGKTYNAFWDRPHQINIMLAYDITLRWNIGMNWIYSTGAPYSAPISFYSYNGQEVPVYGQKNNARLPDYHRLDLSATVRLNKNPALKFTHSLSFSVFNFYGRKNALFINYNKTEVDPGTFRIPTELLNADRTTSQFYLFRFAPSVSYNFKWL